MLLKRSDLPFWLNIAATALLMFVAPPRPARKETVGKEERPFGEPQSSEEPYDLELRRAHERGRGRHATHPLQIPWNGWYDVLWRTYREMQSDRLLSIAGGVAFLSCSRSSPPSLHWSRPMPCSLTLPRSSTTCRC